MEMKTGEALESYMQRIRNAVDLLRSGKIHIHPILITLIAVRGLDSSYEAVKHDLSVQSDKYANLDLETLETRCETFASTAKTVQSDAAIPTTAAAVTTNTRTRSRDQARTNPNYLPEKGISRHHVMKQLAKADTECPLCFHDHGFVKCSKALGSGYVVKHDPTKAKVASTHLIQDRTGRRRPVSNVLLAARLPRSPSFRPHPPLKPLHHLPLLPPRLRVRVTKNQ